ncbi:MAG TPA: hypothetical protein VEC11_17515 [Allosphingosinicella sp.]|nr:hypothetical protein [Allosphingosinicella sp.]
MHGRPQVQVTRKKEKVLRARSTGAELVWLLGQPHLGDYLDFVKTKVIGGAELDPRMLADEWRAANDVYAELERSEDGYADETKRRPAGRALKPLVRRLEANPWFRDSFDNLPYAVERVELDRLVASQNHVERAFTGRFLKRLASMSEEELFHFCLPLDRQQPPVTITRLASDRFVFTSPSTDFRAHTPRILRPEEVAHLTSCGPVSAFAGIALGFGSNFLSAVRSDRRIVLQNGYHRAYALRSAGLKYAYCVVEDVTRKDEMKLTVDDTVAEDPEFYFASRRPPLLKDFFDRRLARQLRIRPMQNHVEVEIKVRSSIATDWN